MSKIIHNPDEVQITPMHFPQVAGESQGGITPFVPPQASVKTQSGFDPAVSEARLKEAKDAAWKAGFEEGVARGRKEGQDSSAQQHQLQMSRLQATVGQLLAYRSTIRTEVEREVVDLAFTAARRILRREATLDRSVAAGIVRSCMDEKSNAEVTRVLVHPDDLAGCGKSLLG